MLFHCFDIIKANKNNTKTQRLTSLHYKKTHTQTQTLQYKHTHTQLPNIKTVTYRHTSIP